MTIFFISKSNSFYWKVLMLAMTAGFFTQTFLMGQSLNYLSESKTHDLSPAKVSISFLNFEQILVPITAGIMVEGQLKDKLHYNVQLRHGYIRNFMIQKENLFTTQKERMGMVIEAGVDWVFIDRIKSGKIKIVTSFDFDGYSSHEKYFQADCDVRRYWALSGGLFDYIRSKYINSESSEYIISGTTEIKAPEGKFTHINQSTLGVYAGLVHRKIRKVSVKRQGWNHYAFYSTKFYMQLLTGTTNVEDVIFNNQTFKVDNGRQMTLGYRIGWQRNQMGVITGLEFGKMPGIKLETTVDKVGFSKIFSDNPYLNYLRFTFHYIIFNGDKKFHLKQKK